MLVDSYRLPSCCKYEFSMIATAMMNVHSTFWHVDTLLCWHWLGFSLISNVCDHFPLWLTQLLYSKLSREYSQKTYHGFTANIGYWALFVHNKQNISKTLTLDIGHIYTMVNHFSNKYMFCSLLSGLCGNMIRQRKWFCVACPGTWL